MAQYDPLFEVVTDKVNAEVPAEVGGVVTSITVEDGQTVKVGTPLAEISEDGEAAAAPPRRPPAPRPSRARWSSRRRPRRRSSPHRSPRLRPRRPPGPEPVVAGPEPAQPPSNLFPPLHRRPERLRRFRSPWSKLQRRHLPEEAGMRMTPAVRRLVREHNLDVTQIPGTGAGGRVTRDDVTAFVAATLPHPPRRPRPDRLSRLRSGSTAGVAPEAVPPPAASAARRTGTDQIASAPTAAPAAAPTPATAPVPSAAPPAAAAPAAPAPPSSSAALRNAVRRAHTRGDSGPHQRRRGVADDPDAQGHCGQDDPGQADRPACLHRGRGRHDQRRPLARGEQRGVQGSRGAGISYVAVVIKAVTEALPSPSHLDSQFAGDRIILKQRLNIGIAVAVDNGLVVPVIADADQLSISGVNRRVQDLAARARANRLKLDEIQGGVHREQHRLVRIDLIHADHQRAGGGDPFDGGHRQAAARDRGRWRGRRRRAVHHLMNMTCSFDHRVLDGAQVGYFMADVRKRLESWDLDTPLARAGRTFGEQARRGGA